jgi:DNA-binding response OmpR family regulator
VFLGEDDVELRALFAQALTRRGYDVSVAQDGRETLRHFSAVSRGDIPRPEVVVLDVRMPFYSGLELLQALQLAEWPIPVILMTGFGDERVHASARELGAFALLDKPLGAGKLVATIERSLAPA